MNVKTANLAHFAEVAQRLCDLLAAENDAIHHHRMSEAAALHPTKTMLARLYADHMQAIGQNPSLIENIDGKTRDRLRNVAESLRELSEVNARLLKAAMEANQRAIKAVVEAAKQQTTGSTPYGRNGSQRPGRGANAMSLAFNRTL